MNQVGISFRFVLSHPTPQRRLSFLKPGTSIHHKLGHLQLLQGSETRWAGTNDTPESLGQLLFQTDKVQGVHLIFNCERFQQKT